MLPSKLLHLTPLPFGRERVGGVADYAASLVTAISIEQPQMTQVVLCQADVGATPSANQVSFIPAWKFGALAFWRASKAIPRSQSSILHIQYETALFGSFLASLSLPFFINIWQRQGYKVVVTLHHVIPKHFSVSQLRLWKPPALYDVLLPFILRNLQSSICFFADAIIVHELQHIKTLGGENIIRIPIPTTFSANQRGPDSSSVEHIVFFGFLAEYKGVLELAEAIVELRSQGYPIRLSIIGTEHPRLKSEPSYSRYIRKIQAIHDTNDSVQILGYLDDFEVDRLLSTCDLVVLPYKATISASAALNRCWSNGAAVMVSHGLADQAQTPDDIPSCEPTMLGIVGAVKGLSAEHLRKARAYASSISSERAIGGFAKALIALYVSIV